VLEKRIFLFLDNWIIKVFYIIFHFLLNFAHFLLSFQRKKKKLCPPFLRPTQKNKEYVDSGENGAMQSFPKIG
jgi:hypothetical protein